MIRPSRLRHFAQLVPLTLWLFAALASAEPTFRTAPLHERYEGEELGKVLYVASQKCHQLWQVKHFTTEEREAHRLHVRDGLIYDSRGVLYDTTTFANARPDGAVVDRSIVVLDTEGNFFAIPANIRGLLHHSSVVAGKPVAFAGDIRVEQGRLTLLTDQSGHYLPTRELLPQAVERFRELGVSFENVRVELHSPEPSKNPATTPPRRAAFWRGTFVSPTTQDLRSIVETVRSENLDTLTVMVETLSPDGSSTRDRLAKWLPLLNDPLLEREYGDLLRRIEILAEPTDGTDAWIRRAAARSPTATLLRVTSPRATPCAGPLRILSSD